MSPLPAIFALLLVASSAACSRAVRTEQTTVLVAAASDLRKVSQPLAAAFERTTGLRVTFSFASSGQLEQQIRRGASFDVYAPAARSYCQSLERDGMADGEDRLYALGRLVAWSKTLQLSSLEELKESRVRRIAIANPRYAPYGMAAQQALQAAGLLPAVQSKLVYGETVAHTLQMAETGNAEVALVAIALVQGSGGSSFRIDPSLHSPIEQAAVVLKDSQNKPAARTFLEFLLAAEAQRILQEYGFGHP
jgi:molybdate transport system substrate-binding protein